MPDCAWEAHFSSAQLSRWQDAIARRFACRKFSGPAGIEQLSALHYAAAKAELPGVRLVFGSTDSDKLFINLPLFERFENARQYIAVIVEKSAPLAALHAGIAGQAMALELTSLGLGSCWVMGNFRQQLVQADVTEGEKILALIPFGIPQDPEGALNRRRRPLKDLCLDDPAAWPNWAFQAVESMRAAPSAVNLQPWRFSFHRNTLRLSGRGFPGIDYGITVLHAECALREVPRRWRFSADDKSLLISLEEDHEPV